MDQFSLSLEQDQEQRVEILPRDQADREAKVKTTTRFMTKYERARVLGTRAVQLRYGCGKVHRCRRISTNHSVTFLSLSLSQHSQHECTTDGSN
jgi:hypothetical protein